MTGTKERVQKLIAAAGITSRRKAEALIVQGRVTVNGVVVRDLGSKADLGSDEVRVNGRALPRPRSRYLALHKPPGVVSSVSDPHAERVVTDLLGADVVERVYPAGRLDRDSEGLMILTNDGELMHAMTQPAGGVAKVYEVAVSGRPTAADLDRLRAGLELGGRQLLPCEIEPIEGSEARTSRFRVTLHEGKKNQIRRMFRAYGHQVRRLVRVSVGPIRLGRLQPGEYRELSANECRALRLQAGLGDSGVSGQGR